MALSKNPPAQMLYNMLMEHSREYGKLARVVLALEEEMDLTEFSRYADLMHQLHLYLQQAHAVHIETGKKKSSCDYCTGARDYQGDDM